MSLLTFSTKTLLNVTVGNGLCSHKYVSVFLSFFSSYPIRRSIGFIVDYLNTPAKVHHWKMIFVNEYDVYFFYILIYQ